MDHADLDHEQHDDAPPDEVVAELSTSGVTIGTVMIITANASMTVPSTR